MAQSLQIAIGSYEARLRGTQELAIEMKNRALATKGTTGSSELERAANELLKTVQSVDKQIQNIKRYIQR